MQQLIDNPQQFEKLITEIKTDPTYSINRCIKQAEIIRKEINSYQESTSIQVSKTLIGNITTYLFLQFQKQTFKDLEEFYQHFSSFERVVKLLSITCYYICYNLRDKQDFDFYQISIAKYAIKMKALISQKLIDQLLIHLDDIYKEKIKNIDAFYQYSQILLTLQSNNQKLIKSRNITNTQLDVLVFDEYATKLFTKIEQAYAVNYKNKFSYLSLQEYFKYVQNEIYKNELLFKFITPEFVQVQTKIHRIIYEQLLMQCQEELFNTKRDENFYTLIDKYIQCCKEKQNTEQLANQVLLIIKLYSLFTDKKEYFTAFKQNFQTHVKESIKKQYEQATVNYELEQQKQFRKSLVVILCEIFSNYIQLIHECLRPNQQVKYNGRYDLEMAVNIEFSLFFKELEKTIGLSQELCKYIDELTLEMTRSNSQEQDDENKKSISKVLQMLLPYINDTEFYIMYYKYVLASRLLYYFIFLNEEYSNYQIQQEEQMLVIIQGYCGANLIKKMQKMINEAKNLLMKKKTFFIEGVSIDLIELNQRKWPKIYDNDQNVFKQIQNEKDQLLTMYTNQFSQQQLKFSDTLSYVEIYWKTTGKTLIINCVQAAILYMYNDDEQRFTFEEIVNELKLPTKQLQIQIDRMVQLKIFWYDGEAYNLNEAQINSEVRNPTICMDYEIYECKEEIQAYLDKRSQEKQDLKTSHITAWIVKILKQKKTLSHTELFDQVTESLFPRTFSNEEFKKSTEYLIDNVYISRQNGENQDDNYVYE